VLARDKGQAQLSVAGKGGVVRQVLLPEAVSGACRHRSASESALAASRARVTIDRGDTLPKVQSSLGHDNIATTSGYLRARLESLSGLKLNPGVFLR